MHGDRISCVSMFAAPPDPLPGDRNQEQTDGVSSDMCKPSQSSSSSSIGKNSDISERLSSDGVDSGDTTTEVQSTYKGGPLDAMDALEEVLPIRRGISRFYNGKSKSFASLAYASSVKDIAKPENAYTRKRRNLLASSLAWNKSRSSSPALRSNGNGAAGISKRLTNLSRTSKLALAVAMRSTTSSAVESNSTNDDDDDDDDYLNLNNNLVSRSSSSPLGQSSFQAHHHHHHRHVISLSPHLARDFSAWRSFSLADLHCASHDVATTHTSGSSSSSSSSDEARSPS